MSSTKELDELLWLVDPDQETRAARAVEYICDLEGLLLECRFILANNALEGDKRAGELASRITQKLQKL